MSEADKVRELVQNAKGLEDFESTNLVRKWVLNDIDKFVYFACDFLPSGEHRDFGFELLARGLFQLPYPQCVFSFNVLKKCQVSNIEADYRVHVLAVQGGDKLSITLLCDEPIGDKKNPFRDEFEIVPIEWFATMVTEIDSETEFDDDFHTEDWRLEWYKRNKSTLRWIIPTQKEIDKAIRTEHLEVMNGLPSSELETWCATNTFHSLDYVVSFVSAIMSPSVHKVADMTPESFYKVNKARFKSKKQPIPLRIRVSINHDEKKHHKPANFKSTSVERAEITPHWRRGHIRRLTLKNGTQKIDKRAPVVVNASNLTTKLPSIKDYTLTK